MGSFGGGGGVRGAQQGLGVTRGGGVLIFYFVSPSTVSHSNRCWYDQGEVMGAGVNGV